MSQLTQFLDTLPRNISQEDAYQAAKDKGLVPNAAFKAHVTMWYRKRHQIAPSYKAPAKKLKKSKSQLELELAQENNPEESNHPADNQLETPAPKADNQEEIPVLVADTPETSKTSETSPPSDVPLLPLDKLLETCTDLVIHETKTSHDSLRALIVKLEEKLQSNTKLIHNLLQIILGHPAFRDLPEAQNSPISIQQEPRHLRLAITVDRQAHQTLFQEKLKDKPVKLSFIQIDGPLPTSGHYDFIIFNRYGGHAQHSRLEKSFGGDKIIVIKGGITSCLKKIEELISNHNPHYNQNGQSTGQA